MRVYWDTSAAINSLVSQSVWDRLSTGDHFARAHLFSEFFSIMTGRGIEVEDSGGNRFSYTLCAKSATAWLRNFSNQVNLVDLDGPETLDGLDQAEMRGVQGGRVYDYGHVLAAEKAKADAILTRNSSDFQGLSATRLEWP